MSLEASRRSLLQATLCLCCPAPTLAKPTSLDVVITGDPDPTLKGWIVRIIPYLKRCWPVIVNTLSGDHTNSQTILNVDVITLSSKMLFLWTGKAYGIALDHPEMVSAVTLGNTIHLNSTYVAPRIDESDMVGMMVHEATHVAQGYPAGVSTWIKEGLADYIRYYVLRPHDAGRCFDPHFQVYSDGYAPAAGMLAWIAGQHRGAIRRLNSVMQHGGNGEAELKAISGQVPNALWTSYLQACPDAGRLLAA